MKGKQQSTILFAGEERGTGAGGRTEILVDHGVLDVPFGSATGEAGASRRLCAVVAVDPQSGRLIAWETRAQTDAGCTLARFIGRAVAEVRAGGPCGGQGCVDGKPAAAPVRVLLDSSFKGVERAVLDACASMCVDIVFRRYRPQWKGVVERALARVQRGHG